MIRTLRIENFKAWPEADLQFGQLTGLFGTNSSGKTSLLQFLLMLKQTKDTADRGLTLELGGPHVTLGGYRDFIHNHDETHRLTWSLTWDQADDLILIDPGGKRTVAFARGRVITIDSSIEAVKGAPRARSLEYRFAGRTFKLTPRPSDATAFDLQAEGDFKFVRTTGRPWKLPGPIKAYGFPDQAQTYFQNSGFLAQFVAAFEAQMDHTFYLGPLREYRRGLGGSCPPSALHRACRGRVPALFGLDLWFLGFPDGALERIEAGLALGQRLAHANTEQAFGKAIWPHLFRDCAVTELVDVAPEEIGIAPDLLGHADLRTTRKHYIQAHGMTAHVRVQEMIARRRAAAARRSPSA